MFMTYYSYTTAAADKPNYYTSTSTNYTKTLNFTLETEVNNSMNFLDFNFTKTVNRHIFNTYRNPPPH
jgi:hypothetical protein